MSKIQKKNEKQIPAEDGEEIDKIKSLDYEEMYFGASSSTINSNDNCVGSPYYELDNVI